jgi:flagellar hook-associated protein 2
LTTSNTLATIADQLSTADALTFNSDGQIELTINGTTLTFDQDDTMAEMIAKVNNADLGVTMEYDELSGKLVMTADDTGAGSTLVVTEGAGSNFLSTCLSDATEGLDSKVTIDGTDLTRSSNIITLDGVTYTLNQTTDDYSTLASAAKTTAATAKTALDTAIAASSDTAVTTAAATLATATTSGDATAIATAQAALDTAVAASSDTAVTAANTAYTTAATAATTAATALAGFTTSADNEATVSLTQDTDAIYDLISNFVDAYNTLISTINTTLDETYDSDYPPLTDDQKDDMTDEEITNWETKAKTGILADDSILTSFLREMRRSLINSVSGSSVTITSIGITTGTYDEEGQLNIDEDTLKAAIESDASAVAKLFSQTSTTYSANSSVRTLSASQLSTRYAEEGIAYRFYDTLAKYISTTRDTSGNKGLLLEKAGIEEDTSDTDNTLTTLINKYEDEISDEEDRLDDYEDTLYDKYTTLETYISTMNSQLSALSSMTSS